MSSDTAGERENISQPVSVFISYSHRDEVVKDEIVKSITLLKRAGVISVWHDRKVVPGAPFSDEIRRELLAADIILLVVSLDFLASDYCYDIELKAAMTRHEEGTACVVPIIASACEWKLAPFGVLVALPRDGLPIDQWPSRAQALTDVAQGLRKVCTQVRARRA